MSSKTPVDNQSQAAAKARRRPVSLAMRLTAWYTAASFAIILGAAAMLYWVLATSLNRASNQFLVNKVEELRRLITSDTKSGRALRQDIAPDAGREKAAADEPDPEADAAGRQYAQVYVRVLDAKGGALVETRGMKELLPARLFGAPTGGGERRPIDVTAANGQKVRAVATTVQIKTHVKDRTPKPKDRPAPPAVERTVIVERIVQVALDTRAQDELLASFRDQWWAVLAGALALSALAGWQIARRSLRPVRDIAETVQRIRSTTLDQRVDLARLPFELRSLGESFNTTMDRLEEAFSRLSQFSADLAHELRTPLNNLRGVAEVALSKNRAVQEYREALESGLEESQRIARIIDSLLFLARAEDPRMQINREALDLASELAGVREFYEAAAAEARVELQVQCPADLRAMLDRVLLQRAVANLVGNAIRHTPAGGSVRVSARQADGELLISVTDTGCGIAAEHLPHVFDRFYRADRARSNASGGVGLGLAIVRSIASLHGGQVKIESTVGRGTTVALHFPAMNEPEPAAASTPRPAASAA